MRDDMTQGPVSQQCAEANLRMPACPASAGGGAVIRSKYRGLSWDKKHQGWVAVRSPSCLYVQTIQPVRP